MADMVDDLRAVMARLYREHGRYLPTEFPPVAPAALEAWKERNPDGYDPAVGPRWSDVARAAGAATVGDREPWRRYPMWWGIPDGPVETTTFHGLRVVEGDRFPPGYGLLVGYDGRPVGWFRA